MAGKKKAAAQADRTRAQAYRKGQEIRVRIIDLGMRGEGIGRLEDGYTVFIKDAVIGDYVRASIMKANKSYAYAHLEQILQASPHRVEPLCPVARQCGGCQLQALSYEQELAYKQNKVRADLIRIGGFPEEEIGAGAGGIRVGGRLCRVRSSGRHFRPQGGSRQSRRGRRCEERRRHGKKGKKYRAQGRRRLLRRPHALHHSHDGLPARG